MSTCARLSSFLLLFFHLAPATETGDPEGPVRGRAFTVRYHPASSFGTGAALSLVYVFDYWGTKATDDRSPAALYSNVLDPSPDRVHRIGMKRSGDSYAATIEIPPQACLLSYYVTDGSVMDDNGGKTFTQYVHEPDGRPVMGARFRNIDFLVIAGRSSAEQASELATELEEYPQNHLAYVPYWMLRFEAVSSLNDLERLKPVFEETLSLMAHVVSADTVQNVRAGIYFRYARRLGALASQAYRAALREVETAIESIPTDRRSVYLEGILTGIKEGRYDR